MKIELKEISVRELTKDLPEDTVLNTTIEFGNEWSIRGTINCLHIVPKENAYSDESHITMACIETEEELVVRDCVGKNEWKTRGECGNNR